MSKLDLVAAKKRLLQMHYESGVGHLGGNLSSLDSIMVIFHKFLEKNDDFVLSKGHSAGALYITLWSLGVLSENDLKTFHKDGTKLPGHPPIHGIREIKFATGSLGHGLSLAAGLAFAKKLKKDLSRVVCFMSDGEWQEGSTWEALIFTCHNRLDNLVIVVDHNKLQGLGGTNEIASMSPLWDKLSGFDISIEVVDGHNPTEILEKLLINNQINKPRIIILETIKGKGVKFFEGKIESHYLPLSASQFKEAIQLLDNS